MSNTRPTNILNMLEAVQRASRNGYTGTDNLQAWATYALAEEARTANLIALLPHLIQQGPVLSLIKERLELQ